MTPWQIVAVWLVICIASAIIMGKLIKHGHVQQHVCRNCAGQGWVCEDHRDMPWNDCDGCCGGAGASCPVCEPYAENAGALSALERILPLAEGYHNSASTRIAPHIWNRNQAFLEDARKIIAFWKRANDERRAKQERDIKQDLEQRVVRFEPDA